MKNLIDEINLFFNKGTTLSDGLGYLLLNVIIYGVGKLCILIYNLFV
jgi:hypothetical protein